MFQLRLEVSVCGSTAEYLWLLLALCEMFVIFVVLVKLLTAFSVMFVLVYVHGSLVA
jgi:hypothetical protein